MEFVQPIRDKKKIDDMKKILKSSNLRDYCLFVLGINSGLRISDLLTLKISDVMDEKGKIRERITLREKKTGKAKDFPIPCNAKKAIKEYLDTRKDIEPDQPLFPSRKGGKPITRQQAYRILNEAARAVGITDEIGTHTLRKTFGYHAYKQGVDITRIQKLLNHSAPSVTLAYIGITQEELDNIYISLNL
ncbi:site-specific integrase [Desulfofundulus thermocisternus]|uniref:site-specific integrase n=1 Tax=Desulfofundulus thermocisternus TaxID=42471 RepID=UPI00217CD115|nr:site-specific integrase [Desulfofundulus thermocisternus]MCS5695257.1 site-specific integrase [Desulfofundulus thermocisternus]